MVSETIFRDEVRANREAEKRASKTGFVYEVLPVQNGFAVVKTDTTAAEASLPW